MAATPSAATRSSMPKAWSSANNTNIRAQAFAGNGGTGGTGWGGNTIIEAYTGSTLTIAGNLEVAASGHGGDGNAGNGGDGHGGNDGDGSAAGYIRAQDDSTIDVSGQIQLIAHGHGGAGMIGGPPSGATRPWNCWGTARP